MTEVICKSCKSEKVVEIKEGRYCCAECELVFDVTKEGQTAVERGEFQEYLEDRDSKMRKFFQAELDKRDEKIAELIKGEKEKENGERTAPKQDPKEDRRSW